MSQNQSRAERSDSTQYRKTGRSGSSNQQHHFSGSASSATTNRSFKKYNNNAPIGQLGAGNWNVDSSDSSAACTVQNGAHQQQPTHRVSTSIPSNVKPTNAPPQKITRAVPKSLASNVSSTAAPSNEDSDSNSGSLLSPSPSCVKDKLPDANVIKSIVTRRKKKKKELYRKDEAAATSSDLYMAYKGPKEKKKTVTTTEGSVNSSSISEKQTSVDLSEENAVVREKPAPGKVEADANGIKSVVTRRKKEKKELYRNDEAAGTSSDLYMACKGPEEKKEIVTTITEGSENSSSISEKQTSADVSQENAVVCEKLAPGKVEPDANVTKSVVLRGTKKKLRGKKKKRELYMDPVLGVSNAPATSTPSNVKPTDAPPQKITQAVPKSPASNVSSTAAPSNVSNASSEPKAPTIPGKAPGDASKSFPLQFGSITPGFMDGTQADYEFLRAAPALPTPLVPKQHLPKKDADQPNSGEAHPASKSKRDAQVSAVPPGTQVQKPSLHPIPGMPMQMPSHQPQIPVQFGSPNPQIQSQAMSGTSLPMPIPISLPLGNLPVQHSMFVPSLQPHPMQSQGMMHQGQSLNFSPQMGPQLSPQLGNMGMSLAPKFPQQPAVKYSRSRKTVKITHPETHGELRLDSSQVKQVNIDNVITLCCLVSQIFDKAVMEPSFCEMYANLCFHLAAELPELWVDNERITFKRLLLNKCQEEFEREEREEQEANKAEEEGEAKQSEEEREEKRILARRRMLGNIRLIGELYKKRMLTERIMHECINKLLGQPQNPNEGNIEALCQLMSTIGEMIDHQRAKEHMDAYYDIMAQLSNNTKLSSRVRFMLKDAIDLRNNNWQQRRKVEGPKKIEDVHRDAAQEQQAQAKLGCAPSLGNSVRRGPPMDFCPRSPIMLPSRNSQISGFRGAPTQVRGYGSQDVQMEGRYISDNRTISVPLPQRPLGDDSITLGPQGGLARGMAFRGQPSAPNVPLAEMPSPGDGRRMGPVQNGFSSMPEWAAYCQTEDLMPRYMPDRFAAPRIYDQSCPQERNSTHGSRDVINIDRASDRSLPTPPPRGEPPSSTHDMSSDKVWPEKYLQDKSVAAIKEFYRNWRLLPIALLLLLLSCYCCLAAD